MSQHLHLFLSSNPLIHTNQNLNHFINRHIIIASTHSMHSQDCHLNLL